MTLTRQQAKKITKAMDAAKKAMESELKQLEKEFADLEKLTAAKPPKMEEISQQVFNVDLELDDYWKLHTAYLAELLTAGSDKEVEAELERKSVIRKRRIKVGADIDKLSRVNTTGAPKAPAGTPPNGDTYRVNLPKREVQRFDGDVRNWRSFWASFQEIDADPVIPDMEKYHYLLQAMVPDSRPHQVVKSYPPDGPSYALARDELKDKFGRNKTIIKVYIRDLLKQVVENSKDKKGDFTQRVTTITAQIRSLQQLGVTQEKSGVILYPIIECCIPQDVLNRYLQIPNVKEEIPELLDFLNNEVRRLDETALAQGSFEDSGNKQPGKSQQKNGTSKSTTPTAATFINADGKTTRVCGFCGGKHHTADCRKAISMSLSERRDSLKKNGCCFRCLQPGHGSRKCQKQITCILCQKSHHTLMCWEANNSSKEEKDSQSCDSSSSSVVAQVPATSNADNGGVKKATGLSNYISKPDVLLQTLYIKIYGERGSKVIRAMIDPGSQCTYIKRTLAEALRFPLIGKEKVIHQTFGAVLSKEVVHTVLKVEVSGIHHPYDHRYNFQASVLDNLANDLIAPPQGPWMEECGKKGIRLTDISGEAADIELLIGNDISPYLKAGMRSMQLDSGLVVTESKLGWFLEGKVKGSESANSSKAMLCINMQLSNLDVSKLWDLETIGIRDSPAPHSREELEESALDHFRKTVSQDATGRFKVSLPWIDGHRPLPQNKAVATARLHATTKNLIRDGRLKDYDDIFQLWLSQGIIEVVPSSTTEAAGYVHYLPHRAVYKENSTTPTRPVFNASSKVRDNPSLNDCLEVGPNLLELIPSIFVGFRMEKVGVSSDICKAFLQIEVMENDRDCMRFLWWKDVNSRKEVVEFRHCRVVFGVSSSPFLLGATIKWLLDKHQQQYPDTVKILEKAFYVDNCVASFPSLQQALIFEKEARELLALGQFDLRGWEIGTTSEEKKVSVLGMIWNRRSGTLHYDLGHLKEKFNMEFTKRSVISYASMVFDPLGLICPFTIVAKILFKRLCMDERKFGWDTPLPEEYKKELSAWKQQALMLEQVSIPRFMGGISDEKDKWTIYTFCDASRDCYACCCYLRVNSHPVHVELIQARSRVTPKKAVTIPRAELLACLIGARLTTKIKEDMGMPDIPVTFLSDSSTAITWITKTDGNWASWVNNRVTEIRKLTTPSSWRHVPGEKNPADIPSRGCSVDKLIKTKWWEGPTWLYSAPESFPRSNVEYDEDTVNQERRKTIVSAIAVKLSPPKLMDSLVRLGDYHRILRFVAFLIRFVRNKFILKKKRAIGSILEVSAEEIKEAETFIIRHIQQSTWGSQPPSGINCEISDDGVIRVVTRLINGDDNASFQRPALLPGKHPLVKLIIYKHHSLASHAGVQYMQAIIREKFWIINNRRSIRNVVQSCPICRKYNAKRCHVQEAPLPANRINPTKCFDVTGIDLAGPLFLKNGEKVWITIFTCAVYRAVHLELVSSLSTSAFIMAFTKFVARRGRPSVIYSDNGTNFHGCANLFKRVDWSKVQRVAAVQEIKWIFNATSAPWWGGFWERLVGLMKQLLRRNLGKRTLDYLELDVLVTEVEAVMNDRPLTYISEDADDLRALTPALFMKDVPVSSIPELDISSQELNKRLRYMQRVKQQLRQRFRSEYLAQLISGGSTKPNSVLKPGDVVLVECDNRKRWDWPMGVVVEVFPGKLASRSALIRTTQGEMKRPFQRLFLLEVKRTDELPSPEGLIPKKEENTTLEDDDEDIQDGVVPDTDDPEPVIITRSGRRVIKPDVFKF